MDHGPIRSGTNWLLLSPDHADRYERTDLVDLIRKGMKSAGLIYAMFEVLTVLAIKPDSRGSVSRKVRQEQRHNGYERHHRDDCEQCPF